MSKDDFYKQPLRCRCHGDKTVMVGKSFVRCTVKMKRTCNVHIEERDDKQTNAASTSISKKFKSRAK